MIIHPCVRRGLMLAVLRGRCGHCKAMAPAWRQLGDEYAAADDVLIAEVDCTSNEALCSEYKVDAYPTLKIIQGGDSELQAYEGEMTYEHLLSASKDKLKPACLPANREACSLSQHAAHQILDPHAVFGDCEFSFRNAIVCYTACTQSTSPTSWPCCQTPLYSSTM